MCRATWPDSTDQVLIVGPFNKSGVSALDLDRTKHTIRELPWDDFDKMTLVEPQWTLAPLELFCRISWESGMALYFDRLREAYNPRVYYILNRLMRNLQKNENSVRPALLRNHKLLLHYYMKQQFDFHEFVRSCVKGRPDVDWLSESQLMLYMGEIHDRVLEIRLNEWVKGGSLAWDKAKGGHLPDEHGLPFKEWKAGAYSLEQLFYGENIIMPTRSL